jgi:hypothetical protein
MQGAICRGGVIAEEEHFNGTPGADRRAARIG